MPNIPAFPVKNEQPAYHTGMTLRDYLAGQSLIGYRAYGYTGKNSELANDCYADADAMIKAREGKCQ